MRSIEVGTDVFAKIWSHREDGEETEDAILRRLLGIADPTKDTESTDRVRWRDDVRLALFNLGGSSDLSLLYNAVQKIRLQNGRSVPVNFKAIVRRELEYNSSDSEAFTGRFDWFRSVGGIGSGQWALRTGL